ncbi:MAG: ECF transporter S component [Bacteroidaceae bacterium]|nr:ECF transporter S component [Bacteroidaceae bacterium]
MEYLPQASTLTLSNARTYLFAVLFTVGNIAFPQLCHLIPQGGLMLQPILFFTLIAACRFGWRVALLTAVASPLINTLLFAMPSEAMLPVVLIKSIVLALAVSKVVTLCSDMQMTYITAVIISVLVVGNLAEWVCCSSMTKLKLCIPGVALLTATAYWMTKRC